MVMGNVSSFVNFSTCAAVWVVVVGFIIVEKGEWTKRKCESKEEGQEEEEEEEERLLEEINKKRDIYFLFLKDESRNKEEREKEGKKKKKRRKESKATKVFIWIGQGMITFLGCKCKQNY